MAKKQKKFHVAIIIPENYRENGRVLTRPGAELLIYGLAEHYPEEDPENRFDYDIDEVYFKDHESGEFKRLPLSVVEALAGVDSIKGLNHFHQPCLKQATVVFANEYSDEEVAQNFSNLKTVAA